jgi:hypothetical protein
MALMHERLTDEREHAATGKQVAATLLMVLVAVLGMNAWALQKSPLRTRTSDGLIVGSKWELASNGVAPGSVVVVGDSGGNFAVVGSVLTEALGVPTVNLCTYGRFVMTGPRWMLDRACSKSEAPPALALVVIGTQTLVKKPTGFQFAQIPVSVRSAAAGSAGLSTNDLGQLIVARLFPLFSQSTSIGNAIRSGKWTVDPNQMPIDPDGSSSILPIYQYPPGIPDYVTDKAIPEIKEHVGPIPSVSDRQNIERMIQDADSRGYDLVFVDGPIYSGMVDLPEQVELTRQFHEYIDAICATSERAWHLPGPIQTFDATDLQNPFHLMRPAALRYSAELGNRLKSLGLPREP